MPENSEEEPTSEPSHDPSGGMYELWGDANKGRAERIMQLVPILRTTIDVHGLDVFGRAYEIARILHGAEEDDKHDASIAEEGERERRNWEEFKCQNPEAAARREASERRGSPPAPQSDPPAPT